MQIEEALNNYKNTPAFWGNILVSRIKYHAGCLVCSLRPGRILLRIQLVFFESTVLTLFTYLATFGIVLAWIITIPYHISKLVHL
jgi:hypothetical protein